LLHSGLDVLLILVSKLLHEAFDELILLLDDLFACLLLDFDVLRQFFTIFFLFEFLPSPIDFNIFLMGSYNFRLNFVGTLAFELIFLDPSNVFISLGMRPDLGDDIRSFPLDLLQKTF
jgi:hypothetical protein